MKHPDYPGVTSFADRHAITRYKFRKTGLPPATIPGQPHTPAFEAAYQAAIEGRAAKKAEVVRHPRMAHPESLNACWAKVKARPKFQRLDPTTRYQYTYIIEDFLDAPMADGMKRGDGPAADLRPRHVQDALDQLTPSNSTILKVMLRKLMKEARLQDWIEFDPTYGTEPVERDSKEREAWPPHICARFEAYWPIGSSARTAYELARWLGTRRSDVALLRWDQMITRIVDGEAVDGFEFVQFKGRNRKGAFAKFHPISPMLAEALAPLSRETGTVLVNRFGKPYRRQTVSQMMWSHWCPLAGIARGYTMHGLRFAMGGALADAGATAHESRDVLGHATMTEANRYARSRDQARGATAGMRKVVRLVRG